jgi:hypothetical protein
MTAEMVRWQPTTLPDGWVVTSIEAHVEGREMHLTTYRFRIRLVHKWGWAFEFEIHDPATINEAGLAGLLDALAHANTGVSSAYAEWIGCR